MSLTIYNTLTRSKQEFKPLHEGMVGMYVCGPTVYSDSHIGHGKSYVSFDIIVRYLRFLRYKVLYVQNITDVGHLLDDGEDRMLKQSRIEKAHPMQIAETVTRSYFEDMDALNVLRPDISPRASGHIVEQIELVKQLLAKGDAYEVNGSVYFEVRKFKSYGKLSGRVIEDMKEGTRVEVKSEKRNPEDFALWKKAEPEHVMRWPSPWSVGFPGWHLECSAMSMKYLGETFDIHGGGLDNQFPHHECEVAQSESATGKPFVRYWIHNNLVTVNGQKMSKSLGNFVTLKDLFRKFDPLVIRFFILQSHYRSTLDFSEEAIEASGSGLAKVHAAWRKLTDALGSAPPGSPSGAESAKLRQLRENLIAAMDDDFNTPKAIAHLFELVSIVNEWLSSGKLPSSTTLQEALRCFEEFGGVVLGILPAGPKGKETADAETERGLMELILSLRKRARQASQWQTADEIRKALENLKIKVEDAKDGSSTWQKG